MASTSSSSSCKYDVFLSFRGEDTRDNFTSHLYAALCRKKIKTFIDDEELRRGDEISPALLNAIEGSKISVVIFSKDYASSKWCLNELVKILECKNMNGQMVVPVFYHADPSDVRKQNGTFGDAFVKHEKQFRDVPEKVQKWRAALTEASNLSGWDSMNIRPEAKLVDEIINDILKKLKARSFSSDFNGFVGLNSRIEEIKSLLCIGLPDFRIVGIWGMGGTGKTTLAGAIFNLISWEFEGKCFMANVREESEKGGGLVHLREQVLSEVLDENIKIRTPDLPKYMRERLQQMKIFIVLDDVNKVRQLEYLTGGLDQFGPGSRLIITTRDKQVLDNFGVLNTNIYEVNGLKYHEALELFCNFAFKHDYCPDDLLVLLERVVKYANGNPLALRVLGSFLHQKSKLEWENALENLKMISDPDIYDVLKISYNELKLEEKNIFLDIACFFAGEDKDFVLRILEVSNCVLNVLVHKSLITLSYSNKLQMHDLLQEMGREIVRQEFVKEPGKRSRLWYHEDVYHVLKKNKEALKLKSADLHHSDNLTRMLEPSEIPNLERINLSNCKSLSYFPLFFQNVNNMLSRVVRLDLSYCAIMEIPQDIGCLSSLKELNLRGNNFRSLPASIGSLSSLTRMNLVENKLESLPASIGCLSSLEFLHLTRNNLVSLPISIKQLSRLRTLDLRNCNMLQSLPELPVLLSHIEARNCKQLQSLPELPSCPEELDTSILESLSKHFRPTASRKLTYFMFTNCLKLNKSGNNILADSQQRIQHRVVALLRQFQQKIQHKDFNDPLLFNFCLPGSEIPDWFSYQSSGSSIAIQLPPHCCNKNFIGFALCVVIQLEEGFDADADECFVKCNYNFEIKTPSETKHADDYCFLFADEFIESDHVLLGFSPCWNVGLPDPDVGHHTTVSFQFSLYYPYLASPRLHKLKCCGVCPAVLNPSKTKPTTLTLKFSASSEAQCSERARTSKSLDRSDEEEVELSPKRICRYQPDTP
ncbi:Disease resistance-like protein DSC1 [Citrus sinensis]|uniref:TMV resistance protein N-like isoform X3 n=1 Tax=Citrus sinensis TaxID=2711 RepID=UPI00219F5551|nr:TMV resistance protein N-like isoform X3 [Citrus sinensis]KAH9726831.1 Disease resistance-like protein DSC1 [Citrus sinensis]